MHFANGINEIWYITSVPFALTTTLKSIIIFTLWMRKMRLAEFESLDKISKPINIRTRCQTHICLTSLTQPFHISPVTELGKKKNWVLIMPLFICVLLLGPSSELIWILKDPKCPCESPVRGGVYGVINNFAACVQLIVGPMASQINLWLIPKCQNAEAE